MKNIFGNRRDNLETILHAEAPRADEEFVRSLSHRIEDAGPRAVHRRSRLVFVSALAVFVLGAGASFGGVGYAASNATAAATAVKNAVKSSATDQYGEQQPVQPPAAGDVKGEVASESATPLQATASSGTLPFTGLSLLGTAALGIALLIAGIALRRRESRES
jgi:hypothetical protein